MVFVVYVGDIFVIRDDLEEIECFKKQLAAEFEMKNFGIVKYFLTIEIAQSEE